MQREDLIVKFGGLRYPQSNLQALTAVVAENENVCPRIVASRDLKLHLNAVLDAPTEGDQCAHTAVRDRRSHCSETDTEAGLGRTRFIRV